MNKKNKMVIILGLIVTVVSFCCFLLIFNLKYKSPQEIHDDRSHSAMAGLDNETSSSIINKKYADYNFSHEKRVQEIQKIVEFAKESIKAAQVPIEFYGKVIDQNNMSVSGAKIKASIGGIGETFGRELYTGDDGVFKLTGEKGQFLFIQGMEHNGYIQEDRGTSTYNYGDRYLTKHVPDKNNPEIFRMWKKSSTEDTELLIKHDVAFKVQFDFTDYYVDLIKGKALLENTEPYDFSIRVKFEGEKVNNRFEKWVVDFKSDSTNGGFIETDDIFMYRAPEDGYRKDITMVFDKKDNTWTTSIVKKFYLKSRNGKVFSSLNCKVISHPSGEGLVSISVLINPNGSTNLEYDPSKRILN